MLGFVLWLLLLLVCWPLALLALVLYPLAWLLLLPIRQIGLGVEGVFEFLRAHVIQPPRGLGAIVMLPARVLGGGRR
jgi:hypothetical protein